MRMPSRIHVLMMLAGGLYVGPFLAGLSRHPGWTVWAFAGLLGLWSFLYQRRSWPRSLADLATGAGFTKALVLAIVMPVLAGVAFLAGTGLSYITGVLPLPQAVPFALPVATLMIAMCIQTPRKAAEIDGFLDDALRQLKGMEAKPAPSRQTAMAEKLAGRIGSLPLEVRAEDVQAALDGTTELDAPLLAALDRIGPSANRPVRLAAVLLVTDVDRGSALAGRGEATWVFDIARGDPELESLFATRALTLLSEAPEMLRDMPYSYDVDQACKSSSSPEAAKHLADLRDRLNELSTQNE